MIPKINQNNKSKLLAFAGIALIVVIFNLIVVFNLNVLLHDDPKHYKMVIEGTIPWGMMKYFVLWPFTEWAAWNLFTYSAPLARAIYILFLMVPLSCCFYYLYRYKFGFSPVPAFAAAVLPNILPHQWQIPAGINMSRTLYPLLVAVAALILGMKYLEKNTPRNWLRLAGSAFLYIICCQMMEQALFLFPPIALIFIGYTKWNKKHFRLLSIFTLIAIARYIQMLVFSRKVRTLIPLDEILERLGLYFKYSLPSPDIAPLLLGIFYIGVILAGFILYLKKTTAGPSISEHVGHMKRNIYILYLFGIFCIWAVVTVFPFVTMSGVIFPPRYPYISAFGMNALFVFSLYALINRGILKKYKIHHVILVAIILFSGIYRYVNLKTIYDAQNDLQDVIIRTVGKIDLPPNSQIVISKMPEMAHGKERATGYMMRALKRNDVIGRFRTNVPGERHNFVNHFNPSELATGRIGQFSGIYFNKPAFFFVLLDDRYELKQFEYVLHWMGNTKLAPWHILHADKSTGKMTPVQSGKGMTEYLAAVNELEKKGIPREDILYGGIPTKEETKRLERVDLDPALFRSGFYYYPAEFKKINPQTVQQILSFPETVDLSAQNRIIGDRFQLTALLFDEISAENGKVTRLIHLLWKSLETKKMQGYRLELTLFSKGEKKKIFQIWKRFCYKNQQLNAGDYIFGHIRVPAEEFKKADYFTLTIPGLPGSISTSGGSEPF